MFHTVTLAEYNYISTILNIMSICCSLTFLKIVVELLACPSGSQRIHNCGDIQKKVP